MELESLLIGFLAGILTPIVLPKIIKFAKEVTTHETD